MLLWYVWGSVIEIDGGWKWTLRSSTGIDEEGMSRSREVAMVQARLLLPPELP